MTYTEIKKRNSNEYFYRVRTLRQDNKFKKLRVYLGKNLSKSELKDKEIQSDKELLNKLRKEKLSEIILKIKKVLKKYNVLRAGVFGSYARGEQKKNSDIDILITPPKNIGFGFIKIQLDLEKNLKRKVDLLSYNGINSHIKDQILSEEVRIL